VKRNPVVNVTLPEDRPYLMAGVAPATGTLRTLHGVRVVEINSESYVSECLHFEAVRYVASRDGTGFSGWIVRSRTSNSNYSDPIATKREALTELAEQSAKHAARRSDR
jgi:hypothetical protein